MDKSTGNNISLYPDEWDHIEQVQREQKLSSRSAAVRFILWQWLEVKGDQSKENKTAVPE